MHRQRSQSLLAARGLRASRPRGARCAALALLALAAAVSFPSASGASTTEKTLTESAGAVSATVAYRQGRAGLGSTFDALRLRIARAGMTVYEQPVASRSCKPCGLEEFPEAPVPLAVSDLEGSGEPDVLLHLYTGGAHCCTILQVFSYDPATLTYRSAERDFGDPGVKVLDVAGDGTLQLESADDRFAYEFAPFAYSGLPLRIFAFRGGSFRDVTRSFPAALAADAARWLKAFRAERRAGLGNGLIAAWAADEELLGHGLLVRSTLAREAAHHRLRSRERYGPSNGAFVRALMRFLRRTGYVV